ncbi:MAG: alpha/beta fold hydrolase [Deltaproteobacteria bacterium]|nr:alpha/beta fold hydrolase [Deltaproteobacteria bacterium]MBW2150907.1 alpha/beta fold hydrolase [Deltaproteobacteria bacterium]
MALPDPVIVIPGITASELRDTYKLDPETVFELFGKLYERIALHPDNLRYERIEPARVMPDKLLGIPYRELIEEIRYNLRPSEKEPVPVYPFAYDWRQPLKDTETVLECFINEVIERTKLLPHYHKSGYAEDPKVNLIGHSMGGLIIAGYLQRQNRSARVGKVVSLGSPFRGSLEAAVKMVTGTADLGTGPSSSREREAARLTPALYHLLPSFESAVQAVQGLSNDLYDVTAWQPSVLDTIAQYVRFYGLKKTGVKAQARAIFDSILKEAKEHRNRLESFRLEEAGLDENDWLCIVGVGEETRIRLQIDRVRGKPEFKLRSVDRQNFWNSNEPEKRIYTGDGTVAYPGARCNFIPTAKIICVLDDDFGYWEIGDRLIEGQSGLHGLLPKMNLIHRLIVSHFTGRTRRGTWGRPAPDLPQGVMWDPPISGLEQKE